MKAPPPTHVVTCFLLRPVPAGIPDGDELLILRRSGRVGTYQGRWAGISGYIERVPSKTNARRQGLIELREEAGLSEDDVVLVREGEPLEVADTVIHKHWVVHPYLYRLAHGTVVTIDWEHTEARWIKPESLSDYETVPKLQEALDRVYEGRGQPT